MAIAMAMDETNDDILFDFSSYNGDDYVFVHIGACSTQLRWFCF